MTLWNLNKDEQGVIEGFHPHISPNYLQRLKEFGFEKISKVLCMRGGHLRGSKVFQVSDSLFCIDKDLALKIHIKKLKKSNLHS